MDSNLTLSSENLVVCQGGHAKPGLGSQQHLPIWRDESGKEFVFVNSFTPIPIEKVEGATRREPRQ